MVVIQAAHLNIKNNCDPAARTDVGAPGEASWTPLVADRILEILTVHGVDSRKVDANFNCDAGVGTDHEAVVALHYRRNDPTPSGFFVGTGDPAQGKAPEASSRLAEAIKTAYAEETGLTFRPEWNNERFLHDYVFAQLSTKTPFARLEAGVGWGPDRDFLHSAGGMEAVSRAVARAVVAFIEAEKPPAVPSPAPESHAGPMVEEASPPSADAEAAGPPDAVTAELAAARSHIQELQRQLDGLTFVIQQLARLLKG